MILMTQGGWGVQDLGKPDDVILERSLTILLVTCITLTKVKDMIVQLHVYSY